LAILVGC
jgi:hypothetical protein